MKKVTARGEDLNFPDYKRVKTADLIPYARNSRTHSEEQIQQIAESITEFGFLNPIIVDPDGGIIAGHGRVLAAKILEMATLPVVEAGHLTEEQKKAYVIADNQLALTAGWDLDTLRVEIEELQSSEFNIDLIGFDADFLSDLLNIDADFPELPDGDKDPYQTKTFSLHDEQNEEVEAALTLARTNPLSDSELNDSSSGNALTLICRQWLEAQDA